MGATTSDWRRSLQELPNIFATPYIRTRYILVCVFLALRHFFLFRPWVFPTALGSVARREPARTPHASLGPDRSSWHVLWGFKVASPLREGFRVRRAIQAHADPLQFKSMSDGSHVIYWVLICQCRQCRQTLLGDGNVKIMSGF